MRCAARRRPGPNEPTRRGELRRGGALAAECRSLVAWRSQPARPGMLPAASPLLTDLYQLNMVEAYLAEGEMRPAVFEFVVRHLPEQRGFLVAAGLEQVLDFLETFGFSPADLDWLAATGRFSRRLLDYFGSLRFSGDVH